MPLDSIEPKHKKPDPEAAGQSGDLQGISDQDEADNESVKELLEEGQSREASIVKGVQDAPEPDEGEVHTHQVPEDDVPQEYIDQDQERP